MILWFSVENMFSFKGHETLDLTAVKWQMRFLDRKRELADLADVRMRSDEVAQFTVVTGRRRVGKTSLVVKSLARETMIKEMIRGNSFFLDEGRAVLVEDCNLLRGEA